MKSKIMIALVSGLIWLLYVPANAQETTISRDWKYRRGDNLEWANPQHDDKGWDDLKAGLWWGHAGIDHAGFAWYRKRIVIPSKLKASVEKLGFLKLSLGQIQDADQSYFNGELIGQTGSFSPFEGNWQKQRIYFVNPEQIKWDQENVIAVRVLTGGNNGGMHTGPYTYEPYKKSISDFVTIYGEGSSENKSTIGEKKLTVKFNNQGEETYKGYLLFQLKEDSGKMLDSRKEKVVIEKGSGPANTYSFSYSIPSEGIFKVESVFTETKTGNKLKKELIISSIERIDLPVSERPSVVVQNKIKDTFNSAPFESQKVGGVLGERLEINLTKRLLQVDEQALLDGYLDRPGDQNWVGEHVGKYLETAFNAWRYTQNKELKAQMDRILYVLLHTQLDNGYLGTYTPDKYWTSWDVWSHKYNLVGLLAYYDATGYLPALKAAQRIGDLLCRTFGNQPNQIDIITSGTHVGMASASVIDPMVDLYKYTGDQKYLDFAHYIVDAYDEPDGPKILKSLLEQGEVHQVANGKAYEMLSNLVGVTKLYKITGEEKLLKAVNIAWKDIVENRLYITGASSSYELFKDDQVLPAGKDAHMGEGCVTTTWLQLNYQLFALTGDLKYLNQLEKTAYNQLLGAENPQNGCVSYYTSLMDEKPYSCGITCCLSSVPRGISMIPLFNYGKRSGVPTILLAESMEVSDLVSTDDEKKVGLSIKAESGFPEKGNITYWISPAQKTAFPIAIRVPAWATNYVARVDGKELSGKAGEYLTITREWKVGDKVEVTFDIPVTVVHGGKSYPDRVAIQRGPQVLSVDHSLNASFDPVIPASSISTSSGLQLQKDMSRVPKNWVGNQAYTLKIPAQQNAGTIVLVPFADASQTGAKAEVWIPIAESQGNR